MQADAGDHNQVLFSALRLLLFCGIEASSIGRAEVRSIGKVLRVRIVRQQTQSVRIPAPNIDITGVVPAFRRVLQEINGAYWERLALNDGVRAAGGSDVSGTNVSVLNGTPRTQGTRFLEACC